MKSNFFFDVVLPPLTIIFVTIITVVVLNGLVKRNKQLIEQNESLIEESRHRDLSEEEFSSLSTDEKLKVLYLNKSN